VMMKSGVKKKRQRGNVDGLGLHVKKKRVKRRANLALSRENGEDHKQFVKDAEKLAPIQRLVDQK